MEAPRFYSEGVFDYRLSDFPPDIRCTFDEDKVDHNLINGGIRTFHKTFIFNCTLSWQSTLCTMAQYNRIKAVLNTKTSFTIYPYPNTFPGSLFTVKIMNGLALAEWQWINDGFKGNLDLTSTVKIATVPTWG